MISSQIQGNVADTTLPGSSTMTYQTSNDTEAYAMPRSFSESNEGANTMKKELPDFDSFLEENVACMGLQHDSLAELR